MILKSLSITNFRNISSLVLSPSAGVNIFFGGNGSGKTNLLEALFMLCLGRSQRGAPDAVVVNKDCDVYRLEGTIEAGGMSHRLAVAFQKGDRKKVTLGGVQVTLADLYEQFCAVAAGPEDNQVLAGPPSVRRTFLDVYLSQHTRSYLSNLSHYQRVLTQKNAALKREMETSPFDPQLVDYGASIIHARCAFLESLKRLATSYYKEISGGESLDVIYDPSVPLDDTRESVDKITSVFHDKLYAYADRERRAQVSLVGPHRDEIIFEINGYPARTYGSQGQWRTAAISLKLAVYHILKDKRGMPPLLLLDEIFTELDVGRVEVLIDAFEGFSQLFLTTALEPPQRLREAGQIFQVVDGCVEEIV